MCPSGRVGHTCLREKRWGSPNSDEGTYTEVLYIYCTRISTLWWGPQRENNSRIHRSLMGVKASIKWGQRGGGGYESPLTPLYAGIKLFHKGSMNSATEVGRTGSEFRPPFIYSHTKKLYNRSNFTVRKEMNKCNHVHVHVQQVWRKSIFYEKNLKLVRVKKGRKVCGIRDIFSSENSHLFLQITLSMRKSFSSK